MYVLGIRWFRSRCACQVNLDSSKQFYDEVWFRRRNSPQISCEEGHLITLSKHNKGVMIPNPNANETKAISGNIQFISAFQIRKKLLPCKIKPFNRSRTSILLYFLFMTEYPNNVTLIINEAYTTHL